MLTALLLAASVPPTTTEWTTVLAWVLVSAAGLEKVWGWFFGGTSKRLDKLEAAVASFVPEPDIKAKHEELGRQIADNQAKIKTQHDRTEDAINALNARTATLETHTTRLTLLPSEVNDLKADHKVLASKVDTLTSSVEKLGDKQDSHFRDLMQAVERLAYTRGEMHAGQSRPPFQLPSTP